MACRLWTLDRYWQVGVAVGLLLLSDAANAAPQARAGQLRPDKRTPGAHTGPAAALGLGHGFGQFGLQLSLPVLLGRRLSLGPFVGVGGVPALEEAAGHWTVAGGLLAYWGTSHRLFAELSVAPVVVWTLELHGTLVATDPDYGPAALVGYEFVAESGFLIRGGGGAGVTFGNDSQVVPLLSFGVGWKW